MEITVPHYFETSKTMFYGQILLKHSEIKFQNYFTILLFDQFLPKTQVQLAQHS